MNIPSIFSRSPTLVGTKQDYNPEKVAEKIKQIRKEKPELKICLFLCRRENEPLPSEEGKIWMSGDNETNGKIPPNRIHLWVDFTNEKHLEFYHGLFDEIVIDQSSVKFMGTDFISRFVKLFYPSNEVKFIFENCINQSYEEVDKPIVAHSGIIFPKEYIEEVYQIQNKWFKETYPKDSSSYAKEYQIFCKNTQNIFAGRNLDEKELHKQFKGYIIQEKFPQEKDPTYVLFQEASEKRKKHLEEFFQSVKLIEKQPYPYETRYQSDNDPYFIAQGLKSS